MRVLCCLLAIAAFPFRLSAADNVGECYSKKATWQESLAAAREALAKKEADQPASVAKPVAAAPDQWTPWYHIGTFQKPGKSSFTEVFPPEVEVDLKKPVGNLRWTPHPEWVDGVVHDLQTGGNTATYLYRTVTVKAPKTTTGYFGSDDGMVFWLNGKKLISKDVPRGAEANQDQAKLELVAGENKLLFKIHNQSGGCGFYFSTAPAPGGAEQSPQAQAREALWDLVQKDFSDGESRRQMNWEKADGIWAQDWPAGNVNALADRYAQATKGSLAAQAKELAGKVKTVADVVPLRQVYHRSKVVEEVLSQVKDFNVVALRLAITDLVATFGPKYPKGPEFLKRLDEIEKGVMELSGKGSQGAGNAQFVSVAEKYKALREEALLSNPLLDF
ncbi:MAG: hypothetical protein NTW87_29615, partial [Planctomycetota bacterium]|nr:hypothetical protein [Planctomycetota bacterium]